MNHLPKEPNLFKKRFFFYKKECLQKNYVLHKNDSFTKKMNLVQKMRLAKNLIFYKQMSLLQRSILSIKARFQWNTIYVELRLTHKPVQTLV